MSLAKVVIMTGAAFLAFVRRSSVGKINGAYTDSLNKYVFSLSTHSDSD